MDMHFFFNNITFYELFFYQFDKNYILQAEKILQNLILIILNIIIYLHQLVLY